MKEKLFPSNVFVFKGIFTSFSSLGSAVVSLKSIFAFSETSVNFILIRPFSSFTVVTKYQSSPEIQSPDM